MHDEHSWMRHLTPWLPALAGGLVDYLYQIRRGAKKHGCEAIAAHLVSAAFFGWLVHGSGAALGYGGEWGGPLAGIGGYLGVRVADMGLLIAQRRVAP
jgi:hypothetical protein